MAKSKYYANQKVFIMMTKWDSYVRLFQVCMHEELMPCAGIINLSAVNGRTRMGSSILVIANGVNCVDVVQVDGWRWCGSSRGVAMMILA